MKVWTVIHVDCDDTVYTFVHSYQTKGTAVQAVEAHALELFEMRIDPNGDERQAFPGLVWNDTMDIALAEDGRRYTITETTLQ